MYEIKAQQAQPPTPGVIPTIYPAQWELYALLPFLIIFMVLIMVMKIVSSAMKPVEALAKPEYVREIAPLAEKAALAAAVK